MDIFLSIEPTAEQLSALFDDNLPVEILRDWDDEQARQFAAKHVVILTNNPSEFPFGLSFQAQGGDHERWLLNAARTLSVALDCDTVFAGDPSESDNPFLCVVFKSGAAFLADDEDSMLSEGRGGPVQILRPAPEIESLLRE